MPDSPEVKGFGQADARLARWAEEVFQPEDEVLAEIRARSIREGLPAIAVGKFDGRHLEVIAAAMQARRLVEVGTLGGYSGVCLLRGAGPQAVLHTFELEEKNAQVARESFARAGVETQVRIHVGRAAEKLRGIESDGPFDLAFIDADKASYPAYLDWAYRNLRPGGVVLGDNAFGWGGVADADYRGDNRASIEALREFNATLARQFRATMIPTAEGLAMGVKR